MLGGGRRRAGTVLSERDVGNNDDGQNGCRNQEFHGGLRSVRGSEVEATQIEPNCNCATRYHARAPRQIPLLLNGFLNAHIAFLPNCFKNHRCNGHRRPQHINLPARRFHRSAISTRAIPHAFDTNAAGCVRKNPIAVLSLPPSHGPTNPRGQQPPSQRRTPASNTRPQVLDWRFS